MKQQSLFGDPPPQEPPAQDARRLAVLAPETPEATIVPSGPLLPDGAETFAASLAYLMSWGHDNR